MAYSESEIISKLEDKYKIRIIRSIHINQHGREILPDGVAKRYRIVELTDNSEFFLDMNKTDYLDIAVRRAMGDY